MAETDLTTKAFEPYVSEVSPELKKISGDDEYEKLSPGAEYLDPEGKKRKKAWTVTQPHEYEAVPEGETYIDPEGKKRQKPKYEGINYTTQTLYDMALTDKERENALAMTYGKERVKKREGTDELYVEDEGGVLRKPGRGSTAKNIMSEVTAESMPVGLATLGAIGGSIGGLPGTMAGGAGGGILGQSFNDMILRLSGVYDRSLGEETANLGKSGLLSMAGGGVGRGISAIAPALKSAAGVGGQALPKIISSFLGIDKEGLQSALKISEKGEKTGEGIFGKLGMSETDRPVAPSTWAKEAPHLGLVTEVFDPAFNTQRALKQGAVEHYENEAKALLDQLGVKVEGKISDPTAAVSMQKAGEGVLNKAGEELRAADEALKKSHAEALSAATTAKGLTTEDYMAKIERLRKDHAVDLDKAKKAVDAGFENIRTDIDAAMKVANAHGNTGELWDKIGKKFQALWTGTIQKHQTWYNQADAAAAGHLPNSEGLSDIANEMLNNLPGDFSNKYPNAVKMLRDLAGVEKLDKAGNPTGEWAKAPVTPTFGQLHNLRSYFRNNVNWYDLPSDFKNGSYKFLAGRIDAALHDAKAVPELKIASQILDATDASYKEARRVFNDQRLKAVVKGLESGEPADPKLLLNTLVKEGRTDLMAKVESMVGPNLWAAVRATDKQEMLDASKTLVPGQIDASKFAAEVLKRERANMLRPLHGKEATDELLKQAQYVEMLSGKMDIPVKPGDSITQIIAKARAGAKLIEDEAAKDPLKVLQREMKAIESLNKVAAREAKKTRAQQPLGFLYNLKLGASKAAQTILDSEDLILASAAKFGEKSPEFDALRQVWVQRLLQGSLKPSERLEKISPEIQQIMFPGVSLKQMQMLAKEMDIILSSSGARETTGTAASMAAIARVENPWSHIMGGKGGVVSQVISTAVKLGTLGVANDAAGRAILGQYYGTVRRLMTSPSTLRWLEKGVTGGKEEQAAIRKMLREQIRKGGGIGAGAGEYLYNLPQDQE